ncbi:MAG: hypothetical protein QOE30_708, partial [Mycobacterium sp.]|nr:hypothetical protein [Mycobacterium sp.]
RQDSNLNFLNQNQRCCRLHHDGLQITAEDGSTANRATKTLDGVGFVSRPQGNSGNFTCVNRYPE